jgi:SulP family sulfate permease
MVNVGSGGRTPLSGIVKGVTVLLIILVLSPLVRWIPLAVLAGTLMVVAVKIVDYNSFRLFKKKSTIESVVVVLIVTVITVTVDLMIAVAIGLIIACLLFVKEHISKSIIRRKYSAERIHSKKVRTQGTMQILEEQGHRVRVYELCDSLFFGTCDKLLAEIEKDTESRCIVLDLKRVNTIDLTGAQLIRQIVDRIKEKGNYLLLSYLDIPGDANKERIRNFIEDLDLPDAIGRDHIFPDTDHALEWCEDLLIREVAMETGGKRELTSIADIPVFRLLTPDQLKKVEQYIKQVSFNKGDIIFKEGDPGNGIYFILSGYVSVFTGGRSHRLTTFAEGVFFGEMSLFEDLPRSATVRAEIDTELLFISKKDFQQLGVTEPLISTHILAEIAKELSNRLRLTNAEVRALEE